MARLMMDPTRRADLLNREAVHLACPRCDWIVVPVDALYIDRMVRLIEHLDERHDWEFAYLRIAIRAHDRVVAA